MIGVVLIWKFSLGRPMLIKNSDGTEFEIFGGKPEKVALYKRLDGVGFFILIIGFALQIISKYIQ